MHQCAKTPPAQTGWGSGGRRRVGLDVPADQPEAAGRVRHPRGTYTEQPGPVPVHQHAHRDGEHPTAGQRRRRLTSLMTMTATSDSNPSSGPYRRSRVDTTFATTLTAGCERSLGGV